MTETEYKTKNEAIAKFMGYLEKRPTEWYNSKGGYIGQIHVNFEFPEYHTDLNALIEVVEKIMDEGREFQVRNDCGFLTIMIAYNAEHFTGPGRIRNAYYWAVCQYLEI